MARCKYRRKLYKWKVLAAQDKVKSSLYMTANSLRSMSLTQSRFLTNLSSSSTIGLDAQPSARPMALHSSRSMGLDSVPSSITAHSIPSPCGVLCNIYLAHAQYHTSDWRISIPFSIFISIFHFQFPFPFSVSSFHFHFPFPVSIPLLFPAFPCANTKLGKVITNYLFICASCMWVGKWLSRSQNKIWVTRFKPTTTCSPLCKGLLYFWLLQFLKLSPLHILMTAQIPYLPFGRSKMPIVLSHVLKCWSTRPAVDTYSVPCPPSQGLIRYVVEPSSLLDPHPRPLPCLWQQSCSPLTTVSSCYGCLGLESAMICKKKASFTTQSYQAKIRALQVLCN